jgi:mono/diheme cytochrome c family protein
MDPLFWQRMHGGSTHFPIVLLLASVAFDLIACRVRDLSLRRGLHAAAHYSAAVGVLGGCGAVLSGLAMTEGELLGSGLERMHHLFIWPAFALAVALVGWRFLRHEGFRPRNLRVYLTGMSLTSALMMGGGYWGGEMLLGAESKPRSAAVSARTASEEALVARGHELFLMNCAHCHGEDAHGTEEGPNLAARRRSDARIASVISNGIKGQMPRFNEKLHDEDVQLLIHFLRSLQGA